MDNPEKLATQGTQDEGKQSKDTTQYVLDTIIRIQTQIMYVCFIEETFLIKRLTFEIIRVGMAYREDVSI